MLKDILQTEKIQYFTSCYKIFNIFLNQKFKHSVWQQALLGFDNSL